MAYPIATILIALLTAHFQLLAENECTLTCLHHVITLFLLQKPQLLGKQPSALQSVEPPHPGASYNPTYTDHQVPNKHTNKQISRQQQVHNLLCCCVAFLPSGAPEESSRYSRATGCSFTCSGEKCTAGRDGPYWERYSLSVWSISVPYWEREVLCHYSRDSRELMIERHVNNTGKRRRPNSQWV